MIYVACSSINCRQIEVVKKSTAIYSIPIWYMWLRTSIKLALDKAENHNISKWNSALLLFFKRKRSVGDIIKTKSSNLVTFCVAFSAIIEYNNDKETGDLVSRCCLGVMQRSATAKNSL